MIIRINGFDRRSKVRDPNPRGMSRLAKPREELTAELREEFVQRFEHDKVQIVEAMDKFISKLWRKKSKNRK